jgi:hypothetical protein
MPDTYHLPFSINDAVAIECALLSAAHELAHRADDLDRLALTSMAESRRQDAAEARRLARLMKAALDAATNLRGAA